jgi:hypothetical protein
MIVDRDWSIENQPKLFSLKMSESSTSTTITPTSQNVSKKKKPIIHTIDSQYDEI